jgi:hypothetical protein
LFRVRIGLFGQLEACVPAAAPHRSTRKKKRIQRTVLKPEVEIQASPLSLLSHLCTALHFQSLVKRDASKRQEQEINVQIEWIDARLFAFPCTTTTTAPLLDRLTI